MVGGAQVTLSASQSNQTFPQNLPEKEMPYIYSSFKHYNNEYYICGNEMCIYCTGASWCQRETKVK